MRSALPFLLGSVILVAAACGKDDGKDAGPIPPTAVELITSVTWKIDAMGFDTNNDGKIDEPLPEAVAPDPCDLDNTITFSADSTGFYNSGAIKCSVSEKEKTPINWYFKNDNKVMNISGLPDQLLNGDVTVRKLTKDSLVFSKNVAIPVPGFPQGDFTVVWVK